MHLGIYGSEDMPFTDSTDAVRQAQGTLIGARYYQEYRTGCASWPMPRASEELRRPWMSDIPALLFSGERDPVTPPEYGERVVRGLTRGQHFVIRGGGHADWSACKESVISQFLADPARPLDRSCLASLDFPRFRLE